MIKETHNSWFVVISYKFVFSLAILALQPRSCQFHAVHRVFPVTADEIFVEFMCHFVQLIVIAKELRSAINNSTVSWMISKLLKWSSIPFSSGWLNQLWMSKYFLFFVNIILFSKYTFTRISLLNLLSCKIPNMSVLLTH